MSFGFTLYTIELKSDNPQLLWEACGQFADNTEITYFNRESGRISMQFVSTASADQVKFACDEFKKEVELGGGDRLMYKVQVTKL